MTGQSCVEEVDGGVDQLSGDGVDGGHFELGVGERHPRLDDAKRARTLLLVARRRRRRRLDRRQVQTNTGAPAQVDHTGCVFRSRMIE